MTCEFMLREEAYHLFVGTTGVQRAVERTAGLHAWARQADAWLPTPDDRAQVASPVRAHYEPGEFASWIAPPGLGSNDLPVEYDYVRF